MMNKDRRISFRVSRQEYLKLKDQAKSQGQRMSAFLRDRLLAETPIDMPIVPLKSGAGGVFARLHRTLVEFRRNWRFYIGL